MQNATHGVFRIGDWSVDLLSHTVTNGATSHQLPTKVMAVLVFLAENHGRLVTRKELIDAVWNGNVYVGEKTLTNAVWRIRQVMDQDGEGAPIIKTTPKTGYQLLPKPEFPAQETDPLPQADLSRDRSIYLAISVGIIALVMITLWSLNRTATGSATQPLAVVTHLPGRELYAAPSPDGSQFAFMHVSPEGDQDLYVQPLELANGEPTKFTAVGTSNFSPAWAPDSRHLAYIRIDDETDVCEIVVRDMQAGEETAIDRCDATAQKTLSWSPNGDWLVFRKLDQEDRPGLHLKAMNEEFRPRAELADRRISCANCVYIDQEVSWSPDSRYLAVTRTKNGMSEDIYEFDLETWQFNRLTVGESSIEGHTWSETGRTLLYVSDRHSLNRRIWALDLTTREKTEIGYEGAGFPVYLPDYRSIMFYRRRAQSYVAALDINQSVLRIPSPVVQSSGSERNPSYSKRAHKLTYYSNVSGYNEIWIADPDGSNRQQLTTLQSNAIYPSWSPDGERIAFLALNPDSESTNINIYHFDTDQVETVSTHIDDAGPPTWASDGQSLIVPSWYSNWQVDLWRVRTDGNSIDRITENNAEFGRESADGAELYYTKLGERGLFKKSLTDGRETLVINDIVRTGAGNWCWAGDNQILYSRRINGTSQIVRFDLTTGARSLVLEHPPRIVHRYGMLSYSEENSRLYFTHREPQQIDILTAPDPLSR